MIKQSVRRRVGPSKFLHLPWAMANKHGPPIYPGGGGVALVSHQRPKGSTPSIALCVVTLPCALA
jgi:hypothetical protein